MNDSMTDPAALATWKAPGWATSSTADDAGVWHLGLGLGGRVRVLGDDGAGDVVQLEVSQLDAIVSDDMGRIRVERLGEPVILLGSLQLTLDQAYTLGEALRRFAEQIEAGL